MSHVHNKSDREHQLDRIPRQFTLDSKIIDCTDSCFQRCHVVKSDHDSFIIVARPLPVRFMAVMCVATTLAAAGVMYWRSETPVALVVAMTFMGLFISAMLATGFELANTAEEKLSPILRVSSGKWTFRNGITLSSAEIEEFNVVAGWVKEIDGSTYAHELFLTTKDGLRYRLLSSDRKNANALKKDLEEKVLPISRQMEQSG